MDQNQAIIYVAGHWTKDGTTIDEDSAKNTQCRGNNITFLPQYGNRSSVAIVHKSSQMSPWGR